MSVVAAVLLIFPGAVLAQQTFSTADLEGDWVFFVFGAYDNYVETADGRLSFNGAGVMTTGSGHFQDYETSYLEGALEVAPGGVVTGTLTCSTVTWIIQRAWMSQRKTEITGMAWGYKSPVMMRLVRVSGEPAEAPGQEPALKD
ncbi:MAG: hypothetical protein JRJ59_13325 [Deltaproteobacteria bacterium]|nr:hypothetical protein [Deltaproteobacteria bacterium]